MNSILRYSKRIIKKYIRLGEILTARQIHNNGIGGVNRIPYKSKAYRKISFAQQGEDLVLDRILLRVLNKNIKDKGIYVDVGAFHPIDHSITYLLYLRNWKGIAIDASQKTSEDFKSIRPKDTFIQSVVGKSDDIEVDFFIHKNAINDQSLVNTKFPNNVNRYKKIKLLQKNLNTILLQKNVKQIDFLNIDIEGAELEILESFNFELFKPKIICVEIHGKSVLNCLNSDIAKLLHSKGYDCIASCVISFFFVLKQ